MNLLTAEYKVRWSASMQRPMMLQLVWDVSGHKKNSNHCRVCEVCRCPVWCLWPSLPTAMQSSESMDIFRRHVKAELFARSYNWHRTCQMTLVLRGETQTMSHIVESCPLTKLNSGLSRLHSADEDAVSWLTNYGKWHAYEKKKNDMIREPVQN